VGFFLSQLQGLLAGHQASSHRSCTLTFDNLLLANVQGGVDDIIAVVDPSTRVSWSALTPTQRRVARREQNHCSALVRFLPDMSDIYAGHNTWSSYIFMNRIFKLYSFPDPLDASANFTTQFSSYPCASDACCWGFRQSLFVGH
jgi:hypothetical protein